MALLNAIAPTGGDGNFPLPSVVQTSGPGQPSVTYEGPIINGVLMPGRWLLTGIRREFGWQEQQAGFMSGAFLVPKGDPLAKFDYDIAIWESGAMGVFLQLLQTLFKKPVVVLPGGGVAVPKSAALSIHDLILKSVGITSAVVSYVEPPKNPLVTSGGKGPWTAKIGFIEYRPAKPAEPVPNQDIPDPGGLTVTSAAANLGTANSSVTAGASQLQAAAAQLYVPAR